MSGTARCWWLWDMSSQTLLRQGLRRLSIWVTLASVLLIRCNLPTLQSSSGHSPDPDREFEIHGGRLRVITVEFYDSVVVVRWRVSPDPDLALAFPEETLALEQDLVGLEDWASEELRSKGRRSLIMMRLFRGFSLTDDLGTSYMPKGQSHGGQPGERSGQSRFLPAVPSSASVLTFTWLGLDVPIPVAGEAVS